MITDKEKQIIDDELLKEFEDLEFEEGDSTLEFTIEDYIDCIGEDELYEIWDHSKYEQYADRFNYDNVDWFDEKMFCEMVLDHAYNLGVIID